MGLQNEILIKYRNTQDTVTKYILTDFLKKIFSCFLTLSTGTKYKTGTFLIYFWDWEVLEYSFKIKSTKSEIFDNSV